MHHHSFLNIGLGKSFDPINRRYGLRQVSLWKHYIPICRLHRAEDIMDIHTYIYTYIRQSLPTHGIRKMMNGLGPFNTTQALAGYEHIVVRFEETTMRVQDDTRLRSSGFRV